MRIVTIIRSLALTGLIATGATLTAGDDAAAAGHAQHHGKHHQKLLEQYDTNHDGKLDKQERVPLHAARQEHRAKHFDKLDSNGDGSISKEEFLNRHGHHQHKQK